MTPYLAGTPNNDFFFRCCYVMYDALIVWGVYKLKERRLVDVVDDEIRGTLGNSSDKAARPRRG